MLGKCVRMCVLEKISNLFFQYLCGRIQFWDSLQIVFSGEFALAYVARNELDMASLLSLVVSDTTASLRCVFAWINEGVAARYLLPGTRFPIIGGASGNTTWSSFLLFDVSFFVTSEILDAVELFAARIALKIVFLVTLRCVQLQTAGPFESCTAFLAKESLVFILALVSSMFRKNFFIWIRLMATGASETVEIGHFGLCMFEVHVHNQPIAAIKGSIAAAASVRAIRSS